jgi:hypothetical protein
MRKVERNRLGLLWKGKNTENCAAALVSYNTAIGFPGEPVAPTIGTGAKT